MQAEPTLASAARARQAKVLWRAGVGWKPVGQAPPLPHTTKFFPITENRPKTVLLTNYQASYILYNMTTKEVAAETGIAEPTVLKYAKVLGISYLGTGMRKIYDWKKCDIDKLKHSIGKRGRPKAKKP